MVEGGVGTGAASVGKQVVHLLAAVAAESEVYWGEGWGSGFWETGGAGEVLEKPGK